MEMLEPISNDQPRYIKLDYPTTRIELCERSLVLYNLENRYLALADDYNSSFDEPWSAENHSGDEDLLAPLDKEYGWFCSGLVTVSERQYVQRLQAKGIEADISYRA